MKKRIFIAINFPEDFKKSLASVISKIEKIEPGIKFIAPENAHLTLAFLGQIETSEIARITAILRLMSKNQKKFEMGMEKIGFFPSINMPKVLWIGGSESLNLLSLKKSLDQQFRINGFKVDERAFMPHLTIGKVEKEIKNMEEILKMANVKIGEFTVSTIDIMESNLKKDGPEYKTIFKVNLKKSA